MGTVGAVKAVKPIKLEDYNFIHFIGIGGISMSGLSEILHRNGKVVSGSDTKQSELTSHLENLGIKIFIGQRPENINQAIELVVYTAAVKEDNPELMAARELDIVAIDRAELLGLIMKCYLFPICVSGTHGKTTTTSMTSQVFLEAGCDPTITIGGIMPAIGSNFKMGGEKYFIAESCEYYDSFLKFFPHVGIILNVDLDHLDYFKNIEQMIDSYHKFAKKIPRDGCLIINAEIPYLPQIIDGLNCKIITYGTKNSDLYADNIQFNEFGHGNFDLIMNGENFGQFELSVLGLHNVSNALSSIACANFLGLDMEPIRTGLKKFMGTDRRFQKKGMFNGCTVVDDYAHHPTEIKATLSAAKKIQHDRIICVFQPHTYSRTKELLTELSEAFDDADLTIILDIYAAREHNPGDIHATHLVEKINARNPKNICLHFSDFASVEKFLRQTCIPNDMLITMGAGDVYLLGESLLSQ